MLKKKKNINIDYNDNLDNNLNKKNKVTLNKPKSKPKQKHKSKDTLESKYNFNIILLKSDGYVPLDKLGTIDKIRMAFKWYIDKSYREKAEKKRKLREEQIRYDKTYFLRKYIRDQLALIPTNAKDIKVQIDNYYLPVLDDVISTGFDEYVIEVVKMNPNYYRFIKKPHVVLKFNYAQNIFIDSFDIEDLGEGVSN